MITFPSGVRVWLATGHTDMWKSFDGLSLLVQETLKRDPHDGHLFVFRGRCGDLIKVVWRDGQGMCLVLEATSLEHVQRSSIHIKAEALSPPSQVGGGEDGAGVQSGFARSGDRCGHIGPCCG